MSVRRRYFLLQVPGWILAAIVLYALHRWLGLPFWLAAAFLAVDVIKDVVLYPHLRRAYESDARQGAERLIGEAGVVVQPLAPEGYIRVRGELWRARAGGAREIPLGVRVTVTAAADMTLVVAAADPRSRGR